VTTVPSQKGSFYKTFVLELRRISFVFHLLRKRENIAMKSSKNGLASLAVLVALVAVATAQVIPSDP
jgi:hypothetical protein